MASTPTYRNETCSRCGGTGHYASYGVCFLCGGTGVNARQIRTDADGVARREKAAAKREAKRVAEQREAEAKAAAEYAVFIAEHGELMVALDKAIDCPRPNRFLVDIHTQGSYRPLSANQIEAAKRTLASLAEQAAKRANTEPWTTGRQVVTGKVVASKWYDGDFGRTNKLTVETAEGRRIFVSAPSPYWVSENEPHLADSESHRLSIGDSLRFTVTVEPSEDDPTFAKGKRPAKALQV